MLKCCLSIAVIFCNLCSFSLLLLFLLSFRSPFYAFFPTLLYLSFSFIEHFWCLTVNSDPSKWLILQYKLCLGALFKLSTFYMSVVCL